MNPKVKAKQIFDNMIKQQSYQGAKQCALIAVNEILEATVKYVAIRERVEYSKTGFDNVVHTVYDNFWKEVKQEIEKL